MTGYRALVLSGSGYCGSSLIEQLLLRPGCLHITQIGRRPFNAHPDNESKLRNVLLPDLKKLSTQLDWLSEPLHEQYDIAYCMMGTRQPISKHLKDQQSTSYQRMVDMEYAESFAELCHRKQVKYFGMLSYVNASPQSNNLFVRHKGEAEHAVRKFRFDRISYYKPAWVSRPAPERSQYTAKVPYYFEKFDWYVRENYRLIPPFLYMPQWMLNERLRTIDRRDIARAAIVDAERYLSGQDRKEMDSKIGFKGLRRLYYRDLDNLSKQLTDSEGEAAIEANREKNKTATVASF